jgi:hypothetical protein
MGELYISNSRACPKVNAIVRFFKKKFFIFASLRNQIKSIHPQFIAKKCARN